jgi:hypothetical protein
MSKYGFDKMEVGAELEFSDEAIRLKIIASARKFFKKNNWYLSVYSKDGVLRIRRGVGSYHSCKTGRKRGTPPGHPWDKLVSFCAPSALDFTADGVTSWSLYWKWHQLRWKIFKLVADGMADDKANYYINALLWNIDGDDGKAYLFSDDYDELAQKRPELCKIVSGYIERDMKAAGVKI